MYVQVVLRMLSKFMKFVTFTEVFHFFPLSTYTQAVRRVFSRPSDPLAGIVFQVWDVGTRVIIFLQLLLFPTCILRILFSLILLKFFHC